MRRRFIAFLTLIISAVVIILGSFTSVVTGMKSGIEFSKGYQYVYKISSTDEEEEKVDINEAAQEMNRRLKNADVNYFEIETQGDDQICVTFSGVNSDESEHIRDLLAYNALFTLSSSDDEAFGTSYYVDQYGNKVDEGNVIFDGSVARVEYSGAYPIVVIPVSNPQKVESIREHASNVKSPDGSPTSSDDDEDTMDYTMILLWANKEEQDNFASAMDANNDRYEEIQEKVLLAFSSNESNFYYNDDHTEICYAIDPNNGEESDTFDPIKVREAVTKAQHIVNFFNAGSLTYNVDYLYEMEAPVLVDELVKMEGNLYVNWSSKLLISSLVAFALAIVAVALYYRINALVAATTSAGTMLIAFAIFNAFGVQFTLGAFIGLVVTGALSLFSNVYYFEKLKNELYRGRTLKKANTEASKSATLPAIDASVVVLLASIITFFVGEQMIKPFAVMASLGAACNLLITVLCGKGLMWLSTNSTSLQNKKEYFGVDITKIPNTANEEKQTYYGPYDGRDFTKNSKKVGIITAILTFIAVTCTVAFNFTIGTFNYAESTTGIRVQLVVEDSSEISSVESLNNDLKTLGFKTDDDLIYASEVSPEDDDITLNYYVVIIDELPEVENSEVYENGIYNDNNELDKISTIQNYLQNKYQAIDSDAQVSVFETISTSRALNIWKAALAVLFGLLLSALYLVIRYGLSKALSSVIVSSLTTFLALAVFIVCRISFNDFAGLALLGIMDISLLSSMMFFTRHKEMSLDNNANLDNKELLKKAIASAFGSMGIFHSIVTIVLVVIMALGPASYEIGFALLILGSLISLLFNTVLLGPIYNGLHNFFKKIHDVHVEKDNKRQQMKDKKKKKSDKNTSKGSEPEEAIYIGIND